MGVEMDGEGDVSDGREGESGCGADAPGARRSGGRWRGGDGAAAPPRPPASYELVPARESKHHDVRAARAAKMVTGVDTAAGGSGLPRCAGLGALAAQAVAGLGPGWQCTSLRRQKTTIRTAEPLPKSSGGKGKSGG